MTSHADPSTHPSLSDRTILVTGGTSGMGLAAARTLLSAGAHVVVTGRDQDRLDRVSAELAQGPEHRGSVLTIRADVADAHDRDRLVGAVDDRFGRIHGIFANAGVGIFGRTGDVSEADFDRSVAVNFKGVFFTIQSFLPLLGDDGGSIVINASWTAHRGLAVAPVYAGTKAAASSLARSLAADLSSRNIRVNAISPGYVETEMFHRANPDRESHAAMGALAPLGRLGQSDDVARLVAFLLSSEASFITGQDIAVDGGLVAAISSH